MTQRRLLHLSICCLTGCLLRAQDVETYRQAFAAWQSASANLEVEAAKAGELLAVKTDAASPAAVKFEQARKAFFEAQTAPLKEAAQRLGAIEVPADASGAKAADEIVATQDAALDKTIAALAGDPDPGIRQLRQAMEKEHAALASIREAEGARKAAIAALQTAGNAAEHARLAAASDLKAMAASFQKSADEETTMAGAWPVYYRTLAEGARGKSTSAATVSSAVRPTLPAPAVASPAASGVTPSVAISAANAAPSIRPNAVAPSATAAASGPAIANPAMPAASSTGGAQPPVPLARYTGSWGFAPGISSFYGAQPTMFDLIVKVENGQVQGMLSAAFAVGRSREPGVKFTFNGALQATRNQVFTLKLTDGAMGTVELIPGSAFNLLEVKFNLDMAPNKVNTSDVTLLKK